MYWLRLISPLSLAAYAMLSLVWAMGGWLLVTHIFPLRSSERLVSGLATGLLLFITLSNLLAHLLPLPATYWLAAGLTFAGGLGAAVTQKPRPVALLDLEDLKSWPQLVVLAGLTLLFTLIGRGLSIFDDYLHLPLVSYMATGQIPPHFYLDPTRYLTYHYGLQILAASLVRLANFFPWSAWDLSKALAIALTLSLGWLWMRRVTHSDLAGYLGSFLVTFAGGARWLLLLVPRAMLVWISNGVPLINTGASTAANLYLALSQPWPVEGGGPFPFPFAFHNGTFVPAMFALGSTGASRFFSLILLLLLTTERRLSAKAAVVISLLLASLALNAEHVFVFLWGGIALAGMIYLLRQRARRHPVDKSLVMPWVVVLLASGLLSVVQGAFLTEAVRNFLAGFRGATTTPEGSFQYFDFGPQWPPSLVSGHLGILSVLDPRQLLALLAELGPVLLLAPFATLYGWRQIRKRNWFAAGLGLAGLLSMLVPLFFRYGVERSSTRLPATALWIWALLGFPVIWAWFGRVKQFSRALIVAGYLTAVLGGIVIFAVQMIAIPYPQFAYFVDPADAQMSQKYWNQLPPESHVLDSVAYRGVTLFGRPTQRAFKDFYVSWPDWNVLLDNPDPVVMARSGYDFVYVDRKWWKSMTIEQRSAFEAPCIRSVAKITPDDGDFRWLLDIRACR